MTRVRLGFPLKLREKRAKLAIIPVIANAAAAVGETHIIKTERGRKSPLKRRRGQ